MWKIMMFRFSKTFKKIMIVYNMNNIICLLVAITTLFLGGCSHLESSQKLDVIAGENGANQCPLLPKQVNYFDVQGKIGVKQEEKGLFGQFFWHHDQIKNDDYLIFYNPLGQVVAGLYQEQEKIRFVAEGQSEMTNRPEEKMQERLGWSIPLAALHYWILAKPDPRTWAMPTWNALNQVVQIKQDQWIIDYLDYQLVSIQAENTGIYSVPKTIRLRHEKQPLEIKIVLQSWQFKASSKTLLK